MCFLAKRAKKYSEGLNRMHPMDLTDISILKTTFKSCATMILKKILLPPRVNLTGGGHLGFPDVRMIEKNAKLFFLQVYSII